jgi:predicted TIM-barrel fold metal-dependent hydrolase
MKVRPNVFDAHYHVDGTAPPYDLAVTGRNVIFNDLGSYRTHRESCSPADSVTLILDLDALDFVRGEANRGAIAALKVHSRVQRLRYEDYDRVIAALESFPAHLPIVIDAFYYGKELENQPSLAQIVRIADGFSDRDIVIAHCGGYRVLEYFFHLRELSNVTYDLSLSLQYLADASLLPALEKLIRFTPPSRLMFGSDYPYASPARQCETLLQLCSAARLGEDAVDAILGDSARRLFRGTRGAA